MRGQTFRIVRSIQSVILLFLVFVNAVPSFSAAAMEQPDEAAAVDGSAPANSSAAAAPVTADPDQSASGGGNGVGSSVDNFIFTGAATYSIPLAVQPGRLGMVPKLTITYNSYQKNGWLGVGWGLDMGSIQRSTKDGLCYESGCKDYVFVMNGSSTELVQVERPDLGQSQSYRRIL